MQPITTSERVSANYRYIAAYNEVNARIAQRQQALAIYITLVIGLITALVASKRIEVQNSLTSEWLLYGFPVASACLVLLNYKYEGTLSNLRQYLSELESINNINMDLPSFNTETRWAVGANKARRFHNFACAVLIAASNAIALGVFCRIYPQHFQTNLIAIWITGIVAFVSVAVFLFLDRLSYKPNKIKFRNTKQAVLPARE
jgi:hypothetical protein